MIVDALEDPDTGTAAIDLHRFWHIDDLDAEMERRTWPWIRGRVEALLDIHDSLTRKAITREL